MENKFTTLMECPYCNEKGELVEFRSDVQRINVYVAKCSESCDDRATTFATKSKECAIELWNAAYFNIKRKTQGD